MALNLEIAQAAAQRWRERTEPRQATRANLAAGRIPAVESPERIQKRLNYLEGVAAREAAVTAALAADPATPPLDVPSTAFHVGKLGLERTIDRPDFLNISFLQLAFAVGRFVGRISIRERPASMAGYGTGFMVSPRLLLTNNHVLPSRHSAVFSEVEFDYQYDTNGRLLPVVIFGFEPDAFFLTDETLDYTLIAVRERSFDSIEVHRYGWSRLIGQEGKALIGDPLNIIQHPNGGAKQITLRSNQLIDLLPNFAHYVTDTEPGSSGSPVYNDQWEVVALHHSGVPKTDDSGNLIAKDGSIWQQGMDPEDLAWVANEGVRVSTLVEHIQRQDLQPEQARLRDELLNLEPPHPLEAALKVRQVSSSHPGATATVPPTSPASEAAAMSWTIPIEITVRLGTPTTGTPTAPTTGGAATPTPLSAAASMAASSYAAASAVTQPTNTEEAAALNELERARTRVYYDQVADETMRDQYYAGISRDLDPGEFFAELSQLLTLTHTTHLPYKPHVHVYPWVDLHEDTQPPLQVKSIYSGTDIDPREFIQADVRIDQERLRLREVLAREASFGVALGQEQLALLETALPFNCEHVVPQSWFKKRAPMVGDLHHLFACESRCNSFRGNTPYFDFTDFEEAIRQDCGKREELRFEPQAGKGAVARATLYFLLRYPGEIDRNSKEYTGDRIPILLQWHAAEPPNRYEKHRNAAICEKQGNRNPLIDFPEWAARIDFLKGLGRAGRAGARP